QAEINAEVMVESDSNFTDLKAFPNPFQDKISLTMKVDREAEGEFTIRLHNLQGALVYEEVINTSFGSPDAIIDVSHLSNGTYILTTVSLRNLSRTNNLLIKK
ncbi:MAG: T9SS type A sorting domain-containing protein, partial [Bacteroidota bacterium]